MSTFNPVPKPQKEKPKKKKQNGWKNKNTRYCFYTGEPGAERHEVYGGSNRQISINRGFQVDLCPEIHRSFHDPKTDLDFERIRFWKMHYQIIFEEEKIESGRTPKQAREDWMDLIRKSYLEVVE